MRRPISLSLGLLFSFWIATPLPLYAENPIIRNRGANDPHIRIFNNKAYLAASRRSPAAFNLSSSSRK